MTFSRNPSSIDALIFGAGGGLGQAFIDSLLRREYIDNIHAVSRTPQPDRERVISYEYQTTEEDIDRVVSEIPKKKLGIVIVTIGTLHDGEDGPEKSIRHLKESRFLDVMRTNALLPAFVGKMLMPVLKKQPMIFAALSARVGSISDNRLGGWHSYRASKAALNMLIRNLSLEAGRSNENSTVVALHPGTVDTELSKPFQGNVSEGKLFTSACSLNH